MKTNADKCNVAVMVALAVEQASYPPDYRPVCHKCSKEIKPNEACDTTGSFGFSGLIHVQCELPLGAANDAGR